MPAIDNAFTSERNQHQFRGLQYHSSRAFGSHILCDSKHTSIAHETSIPALVPLHLHRLLCGVEAVSRRKSRIASISFWIRSCWMVPAKNGKTRIKFVTVAVLLFISFAPPIVFLMHSSGKAEYIVVGESHRGWEREKKKLPCLLKVSFLRTSFKVLHAFVHLSVLLCVVSQLRPRLCAAQFYRVDH